MHAAAHDYVASKVAELGPFTRVVEFGSLDINGSVRPLFGKADYTGIDTVLGPGVDVQADAKKYTPRPKPDCVVCCEVLEHVRNPKSITDNAARILKRGGVLILTAACDPREPHSAVDGGALKDGEFYRNIDPARLRLWLEAQFSQVDVDILGPDVRAVAVK